MISAGKLQNRCPGCRAQLLGFYDALLLPRNGATTRPFLTLSSSSRPASTVKTVAAFSTRHPRIGSTRPFSSSTRLFQDQTPRNPPSEQQGIPIEPEAEVEADSTAEEVLDTETIVRQARQTFGNTLPANYLSKEEYRLYERLYGPPLRETTPEDVGITELGQKVDSDGSPTSVLLRETDSGQFEEVEYTVVPGENGAEDQIAIQVEPEALDSLVPLTEEQLDYLNITANNRREYSALVKLQKDFVAASLQPLEDIEENNAVEEEEPLEDEIEEDGEADARDPEDYEPSIPREHINTILGKFGPKPSTVYLPKAKLVEPIADLLGRTDHVHLMEAAEKAFGGRGLPHSPFTPASTRAVAQKAIGLQPGQYKMSEIEADTFLATVMPPVYASVMSTLVEARKRLGQDWIRGLLSRNEGKGPRVLDVGGGGAGLLAWQEVLQTEWDILREEGKVDTPEPPCKKTVVVGSDHLRHRVSTMLHNTTFLARLPDYLHSAVGAERLLDGSHTPPARKVFDLIIVPHMLMPLDKDHKRKALLDNIWEMLSPDGGVLIVLEKGHPRGFEAVADVRDRLLSEFIIPPAPQPHAEEIPGETQRVREPGMIVAPCTNHHKCPMYLVPGVSPGRKDFCHFSQRFIRPPFLQKFFGAAHRNHEDVDFSYVVVQRGVHPAGAVCETSAQDQATTAVDAPSASTYPTYLVGQEAVDRAFKGYESADSPAPHPLSLPRNILPPLKRHGHVTFDLCTPAGNIERWTVPKSFSKQAYHDARKAQWGDLWALGAKTRTHRNIRLGKAGKNGEVVENLTDGGVRAREAAALAGGKRKKLKVVEVIADSQRGVVGARERHAANRAPNERRTKGGRLPNMRSLIKELDEAEYKDEDDEDALAGLTKRRPKKKKGKKNVDDDVE